MKKTFKWWLLSIVSIFLLVMTVACGNDNKSVNNSKNKNDSNNNSENATNKKENENDDEVVTIKLFFPWGEELFDERVVPMDERLKNINIEFIDNKEGSTEGLPGTIEAYAAEKVVPDIIVMGGNDMTNDYIKDIVYPLDELVEKHDYDLGLINPSIIKSLRATSSTNELLGIPNSNDLVVLYYNKDIFDLFGVNYPTDDMTWEQAIELAKQVTGERGGADYRGLELRGAAQFPLQQHSVNLTDPETGDVLIGQEPAVTKWLELVNEVYDIHGNSPIEDDGELSDATNDFINGKVAMTLSSPQFLRWAIAADQAEKIDFAAPPYWADLPNQAPPASSQYFWTINKYSEQKDAAFKVLMEYLSEETQGQLTRGGQEMTVLADDSLKLEFGSELENFEGKNIPGIFVLTPTDPPKLKSSWDKYVDIQIDDLIKTEDDINTFIRKEQEKIENAINEAKNE